MSNKGKVSFDTLPVGTEFDFASRRWVKKSTRTASMLEPSHLIGKWHYFCNKDWVTPLEKEAKVEGGN